MTSMLTFSANIMEVLVDVQTELVFFALAIGTHLLFFNRWSKGSPYTMFFNKMPKSWEFTKNQPPSQNSAAPSSTVVALKASLRTGDIKSAMVHFEALNSLWQSGDESPSSAPQMLMEQLVKLAMQSDAQSELLALLTKLGLSANALDLMLAESVGKSKEVRTIMGSMRAAGSKPTIVTFNKVLGGAIASDAQAAWDMISEMNAFGVKPDKISCAILLKSRCISSKATNLEKVITIMDGLDGDVDEVLFNSIVDACIRVGRADLMMPFLKKQRTSKRTSSHTYGSIIRAYGYAQDMKGAREAWNEMRRQHIAPISVTLGCMVEAVVTNGDIEGGYELIREMLSDEKTANLVNAVMYGSIVKGFSHNKNFRRMWQVYDEMVAQKLQFSMVTFNTLIDACARSGELNRIPALLKDMKEQGLQMGMITYSAIIKGYCQKNMLDEAFELFHDMAKTTEFAPDEIMYNTLLDGCARQGLYDRGMSFFQQMKQSGVRPSNYTLSVLVKLANRGRKLEKAFEICEELTSKFGFRLNVHVYANLIQACISHHDLQRALGVLERMLEERVRPDVRCYSLLLHACVDGHLAKQPKEAAGLIRAAMGVGGAHPWNGPHPRIAKYAAAAKPQGGLPGDLVSEILTLIADSCRDERLAAALLVDLGRLPGLKLDSKLRLRLAARMADLH